MNSGHSRQSLDRSSPVAQCIADANRGVRTLIRARNGFAEIIGARVRSGLKRTEADFRLPCRISARWRYQYWVRLLNLSAWLPCCHFLLFPLGLERALTLREVGVVTVGIDEWIRPACLHAFVLGFHPVVVPVRAEKHVDR